jgi:hypothetical protein
MTPPSAQNLLLSFSSFIILHTKLSSLPKDQPDVQICWRATQAEPLSCQWWVRHGAVGCGSLRNTLHALVVPWYESATWVCVCVFIETSDSSGLLCFHHFCTYFPIVWDYSSVRKKCLFFFPNNPRVQCICKLKCHISSIILLLSVLFKLVLFLSAENLSLCVLRRLLQNLDYIFCWFVFPYIFAGVGLCGLFRQQASWGSP